MIQCKYSLRKKRLAVSFLLNREISVSEHSKSHADFEFYSPKVKIVTVLKMKKRARNHTNQKISGEVFNKYEVLEKILPIIENTAMRYGVIPVETNFAKENKHWFLRIFIYSSEREITLDDCENISRSLSAFLDELIPVSFVLEVSSPGLDRKLKSDKEYLIFKGRDIRIKLRHGLNDGDDTKFVCKIVDFDENEGLKVYSYKDKTETVIPKDNIVKAELYSDEL